MQSIPAVREPVACGVAEDLARGREPCQAGWYNYVVSALGPRKSMVLDVGAGMSYGIDMMNKAGHFAIGLEPDARLAGSNPMLVINTVDRVPDRAFDVVTCMDVIEHVVDDVAFLSHLRRIVKPTATARLYVTTPNWTRSRARNVHHARELTIPQFLSIYRPDELWAASPDGWHHRTQLTGPGPRSSLRILKGKRANEIIPYAEVPHDLVFTDTTVDGHEWPHMLGVWYGWC